MIINKSIQKKIKLIQKADALLCQAVRIPTKFNINLAHENIVDAQFNLDDALTHLEELNSLDKIKILK